MTTPARRPSPAVYRRRRLVLLAALVLVAALVWLLIAQPWRGSAAVSAASPTPSPTSAATPPSTPAPSTPGSMPAATPAPTAASGTPAATPTCTAADLTVEALTDATEYQAGQNPQLSIRLTNRGAVDCAMNVGTAAQTLAVLSGDDVWWRSTDCQTESADQIVTLAVGQSVTSVTPVVWDRTRSAVDTCAAARPAAPGGGATYRLRVTIGGVPSSNDPAFLLY